MLKMLPAKFVPALMFVITCASGAYGRLGETEAELVRRFGQPLTNGQETLVSEGRITKLWPQKTYRQDDWEIRCDMVDERCARIRYTKRGEWTEEQLQTVLNSNAQGATWSDVSRPSVRKLAREWKRADSATAVWKAGVGMTLTSPAYARAKEIAEAKVKAQSRQVPKI